MKFISPSRIDKKDIKKVKILEEKEIKAQSATFSQNCVLLWTPYLKLRGKAWIREGRIIEIKTAVNVGFSIPILLKGEEGSIEDVLLLFRPNLMEKEIEKSDSLPSFKSIESPTYRLSPSLNFSLQNLSERLTSFSQVLRKTLREKRGEMKERYTKGGGLAGPLPGSIGRYKKGDTKATEDLYTHLQGVKIVLTEALGINNLPQRVRFRKEGKFYYPYILVSLRKGKKFLFIDAVKRGIIFRKLFLDPALSRITNQYEEIGNSIRQLF